MKRGRRETAARLALVAVNVGSILGLLAGFYSSNRHKSCEEGRTRRVLFHQHDATTAVLNMLLVPKRKDSAGDYDDALYDQVERARRSRARFVQYLNDQSCSGWDRSAQWGLCLSGVFQVLAGMTTVLLRLGD